MAVCRIFAGATVTNISDKATLALAPRPPSSPPPPTAFRPIPSRPGVPFRISLYWFTANWYSPPVSYFPSCERVHSTISIPRSDDYEREVYTILLGAKVARELNQRCILGRYVSIWDFSRNIWSSLRSSIFSHYVLRWLFKVLRSLDDISVVSQTVYFRM